MNKTRTLIFALGLWLLLFGSWGDVFAQQAGDSLEFTLDASAKTIPLPKIFKPSIDFSGRGFNRHKDWPQATAAPEVLDLWQKDINFPGIYRLQYNLWQINELSKDKNKQAKLRENYEGILKKVTEAGGVVLLDLFGMPAGLGKALDKKSAPVDWRAFKAFIKEHIRVLSCEKKYNIWYEVWTAPDLDDFFLGRRQDYLTMYRAVAEAAKELEKETKIHIPVGGPSTSWWFQTMDSNTAATPERSLIYELIRFCYHYRLPLDFISWHAFSTDPKAEQETTIYNKSEIALIRKWLSYFRFDQNTPLIISEWNYDSGANILPARKEKGYIMSSFIPSRLQNMYEAGINFQTFFALEDFYDRQDQVISNVGIFLFDHESSEYRGQPKSAYNVFRMFANLEDNLLVSQKLDNEFCGIIAARGKDKLTLLIYNYIDPNIERSHISRKITSLSASERKFVLNFIKSGQIDRIMLEEFDISKIKATAKVKALLKKAKELKALAGDFSAASRNIKINIKKLPGSYLYQRFSVDSSCGLDCKFIPAEEKTLDATDLYQESVTMAPYSVQLIVFTLKPAETPVADKAQESKEEKKE